MSGFVAEFLVFVGAFPIWTFGTVIGIFTIVLTAGYVLWLLQRVFFGPERPEWQRLGDASSLEKVTVSVLVVTILAVGLFPSIIGTSIISGIVPIAARYWGS